MRSHPNRREFVQMASALTAGSVGANLLHATVADTGLLPLIDTHQHLWDRHQFRLPWIQDGTPLAHDFVMADYRTAATGLNVVKTIYMEVDVDPNQQQAEADFVIATCKAANTPMVAGVVSGRPASDGFAEYVKPFRGNSYIKGIRQVLHGGSTPAGYCQDRQFIKGVALLGELGLRFDLCMRSAELPDAARLLDACPNTQFILDHCGNEKVPNADRTAWKRDLAAVARRTNVVCKVSGLINTAGRGQWKPDDLAPIVNFVLDTFGPDRVMFGGDWPVCTLGGSLADWVNALRAIVKSRPESEQRKLFHDNAVRVYSL